MSRLLINMILSVVFLLGPAVGCGQSASTESIVHLSAIEANRLIAQNKANSKFVILDVRTPREYAQGHIAGALLLDYTSADFKKGLERFDRSDTYLIYCRTGNRSARALKLIEKMQFSHVYHLKSGIVGWAAAHLPITK